METPHSNCDICSGSVTFLHADLLFGMVSAYICSFSLLGVVGRSKKGENPSLPPNTNTCFKSNTSVTSPEDLSYRTTDLRE